MFVRFSYVRIITTKVVGNINSRVRFLSEKLRGQNFLISAFPWKYSQPNISRTKSLRHRSIRSRVIREEIGRGRDCKVGKARKLAGYYLIAASINVTHPSVKEFERTNKQYRVSGSSARKYFFREFDVESKVTRASRAFVSSSNVFLFEVSLERVVGKQEARILLFANSTDFSPFNLFENSRFFRRFKDITCPKGWF